MTYKTERNVPKLTRYDAFFKKSFILSGMKKERGGYLFLHDRLRMVGNANISFAEHDEIVCTIANRYNLFLVDALNLTMVLH